MHDDNKRWNNYIVSAIIEGINYTIWITLTFIEMLMEMKMERLCLT